MITGAVVLTIVLIPIIWIVFVPVEIKVDTSQSLYEIGQRGTIKMSFHPGQNRPVEFRVLGISIDLSGKGGSAGRKNETKKSTKRHVNKSMAAWSYLFKGIIKAFHCRRFILNVDVDDVVFGAQLYPLVAIFNRESFQLNVNFQKKYYLNLWIQVRVNQICWTFIRFFLTKK